MSSIKIIDNIQAFVRENAIAMDRALNRMAIDIERLSKEQVPHKDGALKSSGKHVRTGLLSYLVRYDSEYARYQEFGGDGKRTVRKYSKPGKKKFFLKDPGDEISKRAVEYIKSEVGSISL